MSRFLRSFSALDIEERILNAGALIAVVGVFLPWLSGEWLGGERMTYSALGFYVSFIGWAILLINLFLLLLTLSPALGGPIILRRRMREATRLFLSTQSTLLVLASLSVLTNVTFEFSRMEVRFGIYLTLVGSVVATLYSWLMFQQQRRHEPQEFFQHPEDRSPVTERRESTIPTPPPPPPPPPLYPEEHRLRP